MHTFTQKPSATRQTASAKSKAPDRASDEQSRAAIPIVDLQQRIGNQTAPQRPEDDTGKVQQGATSATLARFGRDLSLIPVYPSIRANAVEPQRPASLQLMGKSLNAENDGDDIVLPGNSHDQERKLKIVGQDPAPAQTPKPPAKPAPPQTPAAAKKKAGVDSFAVNWTQNSISGPTVAKLRLDVTAKFKKDATHDPSVAEYRQNAGHDFKITAGPNKGFSSVQPLHDDNYSRGDDTAGHSINDVDFQTEDNPGSSTSTPIDKDDVVDYTFTAEQMIIDTSDNNKEIAKRGPHSGTIKGKHPRTFGGVPVTLS
jgi:hypothetical protein